MPTYDFRCPQGHVFERFFSKISNAPSEVACPDCGQTAVRQLSGGAGLLFKGSGFYLTDYGKNAHRTGGSSKPSSSSESSGSGESKGGESKSSDAKPAASSETKSSASKPAKPSGSGDS